TTVALVIWAALTPFQVRLVSIPIGSDDARPFGLEVLGGLVVVFLVTFVITSVVWTLATQRRIPRPHWPFRRREEPFDPSFLGGMLAPAITIFFWAPGWHQPLLLGDHVGAYVWAPANDAAFVISWFTLAFEGIGITRILLTLRARRRVTAPSPLPV